MVVDFSDLLVPRPLDLDPRERIEVVGSVRGVLQVLDFGSLGRGPHCANDGDDLVGVVGEADLGAVELAEVLGGRAEAEPVLVVVAEYVPELDRERSYAGCCP